MVKKWATHMLKKKGNMQRMSYLKSHIKSRATYYLEKSNAGNGLSEE